MCGNRFFRTKSLPFQWLHSRQLLLTYLLRPTYWRIQACVECGPLTGGRMLAVVTTQTHIDIRHSRNPTKRRIYDCLDDS